MYGKLFLSTANIPARNTTGIAALAAPPCPLRRLCFLFMVGVCRSGVGGGGNVVVSHTVVIAYSSRLSLGDLCSPEVSRRAGERPRFYTNILCTVTAARPHRVEIPGTSIDDSKSQNVNPAHPFPSLPTSLHAALHTLRLRPVVLSISCRLPFVLRSSSVRVPFSLSSSFRPPVVVLSALFRPPRFVFFSTSSFVFPFDSLAASSCFPFVFPSTFVPLPFIRFVLLAFHFFDVLLALGVAYRVVAWAPRGVTWLSSGRRGLQRARPVRRGRVGRRLARWLPRLSGARQVKC